MLLKGPHAQLTRLGGTHRGDGDGVSGKETELQLISDRLWLDEKFDGVVLLFDCLFGSEH